MKINLSLMLNLILICSLSFACDFFDDDDDDGGDAISWNLQFEDGFTRDDTTYESGDTTKLGSNYKASGNDYLYDVDDRGTVQTRSNEVLCERNCIAEYQTPLTVPKTKLSVKFKATGFSTTRIDSGIYLLDAKSSGGCQIAVAYGYYAGQFQIAAIDKNTEDIIGSGAPVTLAVNTYYELEMTIVANQLTATVLDTSGKILATTTQTHGYSGCLVQEPAFMGDADDAHDIYFDDFKIYTAN